MCMALYYCFILVNIANEKITAININLSILGISTIITANVDFKRFCALHDKESPNVYDLKISVNNVKHLKKITTIKIILNIF